MLRIHVQVNEAGGLDVHHMLKRLKTIEIRSCPFLGKRFCSDPFRPLAKRLAFDFWWGFSWILTCLPCISVGLSKISKCHLAIGLLCGVENLEMSDPKMSSICEMTTFLRALSWGNRVQLLCRNLAASSAWTSYLSYHCRWGMGGLLEPEGRKAFHLKLCHLASLPFSYGIIWHHHPGIFMHIWHPFLGILQSTSVIEKILMNRVAFGQISLHSPVLHEPCRSPDSVRSPMPTCIPSLSCFNFFGEMKQSRSFRHAQKEFLKRIITLLSLLSTKVKWWNKLGMVNMYHHAVMVKRDKLILHLLRWTKLMENP